MQRGALIGFLSTLVAGCASGPVDLAGASVLEVRVYTFTGTPGSPDSTELTAQEKIPCTVNHLELAVEVKAIRAGGSLEEVFASGGGMKERIRKNPKAYPAEAASDPYGYEQSHIIDMRLIDFEVGPAVEVDRVGEKASSSMYSRTPDRLDLEQVSFKLDPKKAIWKGYEITAVPTFARDRKQRVAWKPDLSCEKKTVVVGTSGDLKHPKGDLGPRVTVYATKGKTPFGDVLLALVLTKDTSRFMIAELGSDHLFSAAGGSGVEGTSAQPGGDGGDGGEIQILVDERYPELEEHLKWEAPGGRGGRGGPDGKTGAAGIGTVRVTDVMSFLVKRKDLPEGVDFIDPPPPSVKPPEPTKPEPKLPRPGAPKPPATSPKATPTTPK